MVQLTFIFISAASRPFWLAVGAVAGVYLFYRGFRLLQRKRLIMDTPSSKVRSAAMGLVEISGQATGPYTINAPITGMPCYYYRTLAWQWKQQGKNSKWEKVADESLHVPFFLEDTTGRVLVDPQGAEMDIHRDFHDEFSNSVFSSRLEIPANISNFLLGHSISTDGRVKIDEYCIKPKNALFILGTLAHNPGVSVSPTPVRSLTAGQHNVSLHLGGSDLSFIAGLGTGITLNGLGNGSTEAAVTPHKVVSPEEQAKIAAALTRAGITNPAAWAAAGVSQVSLAKPTPAAGNSTSAAAAPALEQFDQHPPTVLMKGTHDPAFFISWRSQREVVQSLGWKSTLMIWGGPALTLFCVSLLAARFGWW